MPYSRPPKTVVEKWSIALSVFLAHWFEFVLLAMAQALLVHMTLTYRILHPSQPGYMHSIDVNQALFLLGLVACLYLSAVVLESIQQSKTHVGFSLNITLHKCFRRLFDIILATLGALLLAGLLLLPLLFIAITGFGQLLIDRLPAHVMSMLSPYSTELSIFLLIVVAIYGLYAINRFIYAPVIASIYTSPGSQCLKASYQLTHGQWWQGFLTVWALPGLIALILHWLIHAMISPLVNADSIAWVVAYGISFPLFCCLAITQIYDMLARHKLKLDALCDHHATITNLWN